jgi:hypothetical protein
MSDISFLIELLLNHKLSKSTRELIAARIREVEASPHSRPLTTTTLTHHNSNTPQVQTQAGLAALQDRQEAINAAMAGKQTGKYKVTPK